MPLSINEIRKKAELYPDWPMTDINASDRERIEATANELRRSRLPDPIVEFKNEGIYNCNDNKLGGLFVVFKPTKRGLREHTMNNKENTLKSLDIKNLI